MNYKIWLYLVVVTSIWLILAIDLELLPLLSTRIPLDFIDKINKFALALSYSILSAYIFFFFSLVLPRIISIQKSKQILSQQVFNLLNELFVLLNQILFSYDIKKEIDQIEEKDLICLNGNLRERYKGYYSTSEHWNKLSKKGKKFTGFGDMPFEFPDSITGKLKSLSDKISRIRLANPNFHVDEKFSEVLSSIETNKIIEWYGVNNVELFKYANSSSELYSMILDYRRLKKLKYHLKFRNSYNKIHFYSKEEIENIGNKQNELKNRLAPLYRKFSFLKPCIVFNEEFQESRPIISALRIKNTYKYNTNNQPFLESKCIIIIEDKIPKVEIKNFTNKSIPDKLIIRLKSSLLFTTKPDKFKKVITRDGLYTIYYRKSYKLLGFILFRKFPSKSTLNCLDRNIHNIMSNYETKN